MWSFFWFLFGATFGILTMAFMFCSKDDED